MTEPAVKKEVAHLRRRHAALPPLNDLPLTDGDVPPPDCAAPIAGVRCAAVPAMAESVAATVIVTIVAGWLGGHAIAAVLLHPSILAMLGLTP